MPAQAQSLARRLIGSRRSDDAARIDVAYRLLFGRLPRPAEVEIGRSILVRAAAHGLAAEAAWADYRQVLLCSNEFVYVD